MAYILAQLPEPKNPEIKFRKFYHVSQPYAEKMKEDGAGDRILISISTPGSDLGNPNLNKRAWVDILRLSFHDADLGETPRGVSLAEGTVVKYFSRDDAEEIIDFVRRHENDVSEVFIHCAAGISRSAGVAKALCEVYDLLDFNRQLDSYPHYNRYVYRTLLSECAERNFGIFSP